MADTDAPREPLYRQVARTLTDQIRGGRLPVGARLPTEQELSRDLKVSRHTVREALRYLRSSGAILSRQGSGSVVADAGQPQRYVHAVSDLSELLQYAAETRLQIYHTDFVTADARLAARLCCSPGREWLRMEGMRFTATELIPIGWSEVFVQAVYGRIRNLVGKRSGPIHSWIESEYDEHVVEVRQTIRAAAIPARLAEPLKAKAGSPALEIERVYRSEQGKVIEIAFSVHPAERFSYAVLLRRQQDPAE